MWLELKLYLVDLRGNARYHVAKVPMAFSLPKHINLCITYSAVRDVLQFGVPQLSVLGRHLYTLHT